jgi:membrane protease YdiL (CAAX protease family)
MAAARWQRLFVSEGKPRGFWRLLLFVVLFRAFSVLFSPLYALVGGDGAAWMFWQGTLLLAAAVGAAWVMLRVVEARPLADLGFARNGRVGWELGVGFAIGAGSLIVGMVVLVFAGLLHFRHDAGTFPALAGRLAVDLLSFGTPAAGEEALFRGYGFQLLVAMLGPVPATLLANVVFAALHGNNPNVGAFGLANIFLAGAMLSVAYLRAKSLWLPTGIHLGWNWATGTLFDLPVSGLEIIDTPLYEPVTRGPVWLTGGGFGPEGGAAATMALLLAIAVVAWIPIRERQG